MALPTNSRVFAIGQTQVIVKWTNGSPTQTEVYRSTDGSSFSLIATVGSAALHQDDGLSSGTKYWYKLSNDGGVSFTTAITVYTHACASDFIKHKGFNLPRFDPQDEERKKEFYSKLEKAFTDIEDLAKKKVFPQDPCPVCVVDGAIIIDCSDDCECYEVQAGTDINSISLVNCEGIDPCIEFKIPPGVTRGICGWPQGIVSSTMQFSGDECIQAPISGGDNGRTATTGAGIATTKPGSGNAKKGGGGAVASGGTGTCECIPGSKGQLTVRCCSPDCSMNCSSTKKLNIIICGGTPPYSISGSSGLTFTAPNGDTVSTGIAANKIITINPPTNSGSGVAGVAYTKNLCRFNDALCTTCTTWNFAGSTGHGYGCNDGDFGGSADCGNAAGATFAPCGTPADCTATGILCNTHPPVNACEQNGSCESIIAGVCDAIKSDGTVVDNRTAPMIAAGCNPCGVSTLGKTVTVTDAQGVSVVTILKA